MKTPLFICDISAPPYFRKKMPRKCSSIALYEVPLKLNVPLSFTQDQLLLLFKSTEMAKYGQFEAEIPTQKVFEKR